MVWCGVVWCGVRRGSGKVSGLLLAARLVSPAGADHPAELELAKAKVVLAPMGAVGAAVVGAVVGVVVGAAVGAGVGAGVGATVGRSASGTRGVHAPQAVIVNAR